MFKFCSQNCHCKFGRSIFCNPRWILFAVIPLRVIACVNIKLVSACACLKTSPSFSIKFSLVWTLNYYRDKQETGSRSPPVRFPVMSHVPSLCVCLCRGCVRVCAEVICVCRVVRWSPVMVNTVSPSGYTVTNWAETNSSVFVSG